MRQSTTATLPGQFYSFSFSFFLSSAIHNIHTNTRAWPPRPPKKTNKTKTKNPPSVFPLSHQPLFVSSTTFFCFVLFCFLNISFCRANIRNEMFGPIVRARTQESTRTGSVKQSARGVKGWTARAPKKKKNEPAPPPCGPRETQHPAYRGDDFILHVRWVEVLKVQFVKCYLAFVPGHSPPAPPSF